MYSDLHPSVSRSLTRLETERRQLLATSPYANRVEKSMSTHLNRAYMFISALDLWITSYDHNSFTDASPFLREMRQDGWEIAEKEIEGETVRFTKDNYGFVWELSKEIRPGLNIKATLNLHLVEAQGHDGISCQRIKVGEKKVEKIVDVYEIRCPSEVSNG